MIAGHSMNEINSSIVVPVLINVMVAAKKQHKREIATKSRFDLV
jgi:hypothetical protein